MKILKPTIYMIYGQYGSGKTNVLFKLCYHKLKEDNPEQKLVLISANYYTLGQNYICQEFCEIFNIQFESRLKEKLTDFNYDSDTTYFIDFGSILKDQKYIYDFFNSGNFNFYPVLTIPAFMEFSIVESVLSQFSFMNTPKILLTFCDYVSKSRIIEFESYLKNLNASIIGFNNSPNLSRGFILK
jgi:flagellar biosynthesis GTPase FlhF